MSQISTGNAGSPVTPRRQRKALLTGLTATLGIIALVGVAVLLGSGARQSADAPGVWRSKGMVHVEPNSLDVIYQGLRISPESLQSLNHRGKAMFTATDVGTATDLHATRAFDTQAELDAYSAAHLAWLREQRKYDHVPPWGTVAPQSWSPANK